MASYRTGTVTEIIESYSDLTRVKADIGGVETRAVCYTRLTGSVGVGDKVILNTTAGVLGLGSGGWDIVVWNLAAEALDLDNPGHILKLRYTPLQFNVLAVEEAANADAAKISGPVDLAGLPVIVGTIHSQLAPAAAVLRQITEGRAKVAYIMTDRASLPLALSDQVRELKEKKLIDTTITIGQAFGGDMEAVNIFSALAAAKSIVAADVVIVTMGVGVVGTDTFLGFSGIEQGELVNAASTMGGRPIAIPRVMFGDARPRHQGLSQQTMAALGLAALETCDIAVPRMDPDKMKTVLDALESSGLAAKHRVKIVTTDRTADALRAFDLTPTTMGRDFAAEPEFFRAAGAAGYLAGEIVKARTS
jgi:hypothetical protein